MIIYPDIELQKGRCVNLRRGRADAPVVYDVDPVEAACDFARQGAEWLHVVDLDAVFNDGDNADIIHKIIEMAGCPVQVGGAIRSMERVHQWIAAGAGRVVIATAAVKYPHLVREAATAYPNQVIVSVDARAGKVVVEGWREATIFSPVAFAREFVDVPLAAIVYTDIDRDGMLSGVNVAATVALAAAARVPVIASGGIASVADLEARRDAFAGAGGTLMGAITGRAIYAGTLDFRAGQAVLDAAAH
jgi:phosphoribosylformimino-5-aminoimidazole carboxamide ribotide isomerase